MKLMKPILFSTPMVQAIMNGTKTQTRRAVKFPDDYDGKRVWDNGSLGLKYSAGDITQRLYPNFYPGDVMWVRETWQHTKVLNLHPTDENYGYVYRAEGQPWEDYEGWRWKPSIFMPKEACRNFLEVKSMRAERLQDISEADAMAEGISLDYDRPYNGWYDYIKKRYCLESSIESFKTLWVSINGVESWEANPWVWVYGFERGLDNGLRLNCVAEEMQYQFNTEDYEQ